MKRLVCLFSVFALAFASDVLDLTDSDFESKTQHPLMLVEFFAPWCGHCKKLAPEYESAATALNKHDPPVPIAKVDCTENTEVCQKYGVTGYPTLKIFRNGEFAEDYEGARDSAGIVKQMQSRAGPSSKELETVKDAEKFLSKSEYGVIGFFKSAEDELAQTFMKVADAFTEMRFAHTYSSELFKKYEQENAIVLYQPKRFQNKFESSSRIFNLDITVAKLKSWIQDQSLGLCGHRTLGNADKFSTPIVVAYFDVDYEKNEKGTNYWRNRVMKVGKKIKDANRKVFFAISSRKELSHELGEFGLGDEPTGDKPVVTARDSRDLKYSMTEEFSMDNLEKFVNDFLDDKLTAYIKSEPVPESQDEPVKVVVAKNFDEIVNDATKDVLIEFYAPWCGHCKQLDPKFTELAEKLKDEKDIVIAKMDATANDVVKPYEVSGFPTLYFAPKGSKSVPKKYAGGREVDDFVKYLAREATDELAGYSRSGKKIKAKVEL